MEEPLEPEEQSKLELRRQKQAVRSAQVIYVLQQQVLKTVQHVTERYTFANTVFKFALDFINICIKFILDKRDTRRY